MVFISHKLRSWACSVSRTILLVSEIPSTIRLVDFTWIVTFGNAISGPQDTTRVNNSGPREGSDDEGCMGTSS